MSSGQTQGSSGMEVVWGMGGVILRGEGGRHEKGVSADKKTPKASAHAKDGLSRIRPQYMPQQPELINCYIR